ncbi:MAG TPA: ATP synthase F1 subunit delta [Bryobacteraceae bacterium]|nr:ATP synthase F1 subunit delta [Bryobacteraceae bacterium]
MPEAVSIRYARALADAVLSPTSEVKPAQALEQLRGFSNIVDGSAELKNVLLSPAVSNTKKRAVVARFAESLPLSRLVRNFLYVTIDRRRSDRLADMAEAFEAALDERLGIIRADVESASPLNDRQQSDLQQELSRLSGKQVRCDFSIDPELIGGVVARIGSTVYDGSVRSQLESLRERLVAR